MRSVNGMYFTIVDGSGNTESCLYVGNDQKNVLIDGLTFTNGTGSNQIPLQLNQFVLEEHNLIPQGMYQNKLNN